VAEAAPETFTVRVAGPDGTVGGLGALVSARHVVTCAHVVNVALGRNALSQQKPADGDRVRVEFPLLAGGTGEPVLPVPGARPPRRIRR
jgi:hypothetical protein